MYKKKIIVFIAITILIILIGFILFSGLNLKSNNSSNKIAEYTPQEELSENDIRKTIVSIYFKNIETNTLVPESICIDVKELADNPYMKLLNILSSGPSSDKLESPIPEGTTINNVYLKGNTVFVDFSKEFISNAPNGVEEEGLLIYSIVNTLTELNEVNSVKILIDGKENMCFNDKSMSFNEEFFRND